jgi:4-alpha-glucanotransferase
VTAPEDELAALAEFHGVHPRYTDAEGRTIVVEREVVTALLRALGVPLDHPREAADLLRDLQVAAARRVVEPILVHRSGRDEPASVTLPDGIDPGTVWLSLQLEDGDTAERSRLSSVVTGFALEEDVDGVQVARVEVDLGAVNGRPLPFGRHRLTVEGLGESHSSLVIAAPDCPLAERRWGVFVPLHAVRSREDWGIGGYDDLRVLGEWASALGSEFVGTLPLYPAFLETPADPSPYLPVSRLAYNEVFVDPTALPEFTATPEAQRLVGSTTFQESLQKARGAALVDYEEVSRLKRAVMEPMARTVGSGSKERRRGLTEFGRSHPELEAYARFRAARDHDSAQEPDPELVTYHLYSQWAAFEQLSAAHGRAGRYDDFPVGSHPQGFDPVWSPHSFVAGVHGGAPPDRFFAGGQDWGFNPLHPLRSREDGYSFFSAALRRAFRHADCLRIDHVMGLQRLFMIPDGGAGHGAYVSYRAEELHALVALEAHRNGCVVVGEDLGTVPGGVRRRMARDRGRPASSAPGQLPRRAGDARRAPLRGLPVGGRHRRPRGDRRAHL